MRGARLLAAFGSRPEVSAPVSGDLDIRTAAAADASAWRQVTGDGPWTDVSFMPRTGSDDLRGMAVRFALNIPQGATITSATFTVYANQNADWAAADDRTLGCHQVDNATMPGTRAAADTMLGERGTTHTWANSGTILNNEPVATGDITAVVQQIVNRAGWASGNFILLLASHPGTGSANHQTRLHHTNGESVRPRLQVGYTS